MQDQTQAIVVTRVVEGWNWTVSSADGQSLARGQANEQHAAMEAAWRVARGSAARAPRTYPDIVVELVKA